MAKTAVINCRIEAELKSNAEKILHQLGLKPSDVINVLYRQIALRKGVPFEITLPETPQEKERRKERTLRLAQAVYEGLSEEDLSEIEKHAFDRRSFFEEETK